MKRAERQPETVWLEIYAGIYCKTYRVPDAGTVLPQHSHHHDHLTFVSSGAVYVERDGRPAGRYDAPALVRIPAHTMHSFITLGPDTVLSCIHNTDHAEADGEPAIAEEHHLVTEN
jgi:quercetin dioxygenase-like cupin family protein